MEKVEDTLTAPKRKAGRPKGATAAKMLERGTSRAAVIQARIDDPTPVERGPRGVRLRQEHQEEVRAKIQSSALVNRLQAHARGEIDMSPTQIKAAEILLSKSLSSLQSTEVNMISNNDKLTEAEILGKIAELVRNDPKLLQVVRTVDVVDVEEVVQIAEDAPTGAGCIVCGDLGLAGGCPQCGGDPADLAPDGDG